MGLTISIMPVPIRTDRTLRAIPYVTYSICFICLLVHLSGLRLSEYEFTRMGQHWGFIIGKPSLVTLFTHGFLHSDVLHVAGNLLVLWLVGTVLESGIGSALFLLLYLASQVTAIILYALIGKIFMPGSLGIPLVGASGAIAGVTGFAAFRYYYIRAFTLLFVSWIPLPLWLPLWTYALLFGANEVLVGVLELRGGQSDMIAHWAHIGGLALGALMAVVLRTAQEGKRERVLENTAKETANRAVPGRSLHELEALLREQPNDPEALEAMAAMIMVNGDRARSRDLYLKAIPLFLAAGQADRAAISYVNVLRSFPESVFDPREQMKLAASLERLRHYPEAAHAFTLVAEYFPQRDEAPTALLRAAQIHHRHLGSREVAAQLLQALLERYPDSSLVSVARARLGEVARKTP